MPVKPQESQIQPPKQPTPPPVEENSSDEDAPREPDIEAWQAPTYPDEERPFEVPPEEPIHDEQWYWDHEPNDPREAVTGIAAYGVDPNEQGPPEIEARDLLEQTLMKRRIMRSEWTTSFYHTNKMEDGYPQLELDDEDMEIKSLEISDTERAINSVKIKLRFAIDTRGYEKAYEKGLHFLKAKNQDEDKDVEDKNFNDYIYQKLLVLYELVEIVAEYDGNDIFPDRIHWDIAQLIKRNCVRKFEDPVKSFFLLHIKEYGEDLESRDFAVEPMWKVMEACYWVTEFYLQREDLDMEKVMDVFTPELCCKLIHVMAKSEDIRERLQAFGLNLRIYQNFVQYRSLIRNELLTLLLCFFYQEQEQFYKKPLIACDNIYGFKEIFRLYERIFQSIGAEEFHENAEFHNTIFDIFMPVHKLRCFRLFCREMVQILKHIANLDRSLVPEIIRHMLRCWPRTNSEKEFIFVCQTEALLEELTRKDFIVIGIPIFTKLLKCAQSLNWQVALKALQLWENKKIQKLLSSTSKVILPIIFPMLVHISTNKHWNPEVILQAYHSIKITMETNTILFSRLCSKYKDTLLDELDIQREAYIQKERLKIDALKRVVDDARTNPELEEVWDNTTLTQFEIAIDEAEEKLSFTQHYKNSELKPMDSSEKILTDIGKKDGTMDDREAVYVLAEAAALVYRENLRQKVEQYENVLSKEKFSSRRILIEK